MDRLSRRCDLVKFAVVLHYLSVLNNKHYMAVNLKRFIDAFSPAQLGVISLENAEVGAPTVMVSELLRGIPLD